MDHRLSVHERTLVMFRRFASLALSLSLATTALTASTADARSFAKAPAADVVELPRISNDARAKLRKFLKARRAKNVAAFRAYANRGVYPHNFVTNGALNVWIDEEGHMCAAATMIWKSGAKSLVRSVAKNDNYIKLGDVTDGPVMDWILTSGLTQSEVATIQEPFMGRPEPIEPEPGSPAWRLAEDARLKARYRVILTQLAESPDVSLDAAVDALTWRPDLVAKLIKT
jgi:hypothetical protein